MSDSVQPITNDRLEDQRESRRLLRQHTVLTVSIFLPLIWSFVSGEWYPSIAYRMFYGASALNQGRERVYYIFRGETAAGQTLDIPPITIVNALDDKIWTMVKAVVDNESLQIRSPHPESVKLISAAGGIENLPRAVLLPDLLRRLGNRYNARLPNASPKRLVRVRLDAYRWQEKEYSNYAEYIESWRVGL